MYLARITDRGTEVYPIYPYEAEWVKGQRRPEFVLKEPKAWYYSGHWGDGIAAIDFSAEKAIEAAQSLDSAVITDAKRYN